MSTWSPGIEKVLAHVRETPGWTLRVPTVSPRERWLSRRLSDGDDAPNACPVSSLSDFTCDDWEKAGTLNGLTSDEARSVVMASDGFGSFNPALRVALMEAAGLAEASK